MVLFSRTVGGSTHPSASCHCLRLCLWQIVSLARNTKPYAVFSPPELTVGDGGGLSMVLRECLFPMQKASDQNGKYINRIEK